MLLKQRLFAAEKLFRPQKKSQTETIAIAFLDTGISPVADFTQPKNRIVCFLDLVNGRTKPYDDNGHGTHVTVAKFLIYRKPSFVPLCDTHGPASANLRKQINPFKSINGLNGFILFLWFSALKSRTTYKHGFHRLSY